jgi:hypothetical protein
MVVGTSSALHPTFFRRASNSRRYTSLHRNLAGNNDLGIEECRLRTGGENKTRVRKVRGPGRTDFVDFFFGNPTFSKEDEVNHGVET